MINNKIIVNPEDKKYFDGVYSISLNNYDNTFFIVCADSTQDALDKVIDYCEDKSFTGYYITQSETEEEGLTQEEIDSLFIVAGNHCLYVNVEHLHINKLNDSES